MHNGRINCGQSRRVLLLFIFAGIFFSNCASSSKEGQALEAKNATVFKTKKRELTYIKAYNKALTLWPVPVQEVDVHTSFGSTHVLISGPKNAPPLVLLHGLNASSTMWYPNVKAFTARYRVYAIDFILEPGKSITKEELLKKEELVHWYNEIFDHFGFKEVSIVGASRGGWLATHLAINSKNRIKKVALLSPAQVFVSIKLKPKIFSNISFALFPRKVKLRNVLETLSFRVDNINQLWINQFYIGSRTARIINQSVFQMTPFSDDELKSLSIPVLVLVGDHDIINSKNSIERARQLIPNVEADIISNTGHFLSFDKADEINKRVMDFLSEDLSSQKKMYHKTIKKKV